MGGCVPNSSTEVRWGTNCWGRLDMKWHPYPVRMPHFVYSSQLAMQVVMKVVRGLVSSGEPGLSMILIQGTKFCWISKLCFKRTIQLKNRPHIQNLISWQWGLPALLLLRYILTLSSQSQVSSLEKKSWCWHWMSFPVAVLLVLATGTEW